MRIIAWSCVAMSTGIAVSAGVFFMAGKLYQSANAFKHSFVKEFVRDVESNEAKKQIRQETRDKIQETRKNSGDFSISEQGKAIRVDFERGDVALYKNGLLLARYPARAVPDPFSPWRVPQGKYSVKAIKETHYSPLANASFEKVLLFGENGLIHSEQKNGQSAAANVALSGKNAPPGIILSVADAEKLSAFANSRTEVIVLSEIPNERTLSYADALSSLEKTAKTPRVTARAALIADVDTGEVLFEKSPDDVLPIASITKLFTALIARDKISAEEKITISRTAFGAYGGNGGLNPEDEFYAEELLYPLLVESSNDAAEALAEAAGKERFIAAMNEKARALGLAHTSFRDASGLAKENVSTAKDIFSFARFLVREHADILAFTKLLSYKLPGGNLRKWPRVWRNNNEFVRDGNPYLLGTKNGYTDEAAQTTLSLFALPISESEERRIAVVLLGSGNRDGDMETLLAFGGSDTLYGKSDFATLFRKKAESYAHEKEKEQPKFRLAILGPVRPENLPRDPSRSFENLLYLKPYDAAFADVEGIIADTGYNVIGEGALRMPKDFLYGLALLGVDVVNVANAHAGDWGRSAFGEYVRLLKDDGFLVAGGSDVADDARQTPVIEKNGIKVGFLSFSDAGPEWLSEDEYLPSIRSAKNGDFEKRIREAVRAANHLIVGIAFGDGQSEEAQARRETLAHAAIDAGARVVVGFYPSENPDWETYKDGIIFYGQKELTPIEIVFDKKKTAYMQ